MITLDFTSPQVAGCRELRELDMSYCNNVSPQLLSQSDLFRRLSFLSTLTLRGYPHELTSLAHPYLERLVLSCTPIVISLEIWNCISNYFDRVFAS